MIFLVSEGAKNTLLQIVNDSFMKDSDDYLESVQRVLSILAQEFRSNQVIPFVIAE